MTQTCARCGRKLGLLEWQVFGNPDNVICADCISALKDEKQKKVTQFVNEIHEHETKRLALSEAASRILCTTASSLPAHSITRHCGIVRGVVIESRSDFIVGQQLSTALAAAGTSNRSLFERFSEEIHDAAIHKMLQHAADLDANAVIGVRLSATEITSGLTEVLAYGTALIVTPIT